METSISVLNTVADNAAGITLAGGTLNIVSCPPNINYRTSKMRARIAAAAGVNRVGTIAFTAANNTTYSFQIGQWINGDYRTVKIKYTNISGNAAAIYAAIAEIVNSLGFKITVSGSGTPITFTGQAGYELFDLFSGTNTTAAIGTAGNFAVGTAAQVIAAGGTGVTPGASYSQFDIEYTTNLIGGGGTTPQPYTRMHTLYVNEAATNFAKFAAGYENVRQGYAVNNGTAFATAIAAVPNTLDPDEVVAVAIQTIFNPELASNA